MGAIDDWLGKRSSKLTWIDADRYVWSVFAGRPDRWYEDPASLAGASARAQVLLRSDVQELRVAGPFSGLLREADGPGGVAEAFATGEGRRLLGETLDALAYQLDPAVDLALVCPSPRDLLQGGQRDDFFALDDVAAAMLEMLRGLADRRVAALVIARAAVGPPGDDELESWSTMLSAAAHYGWRTAARLEGVEPAQGGDLPTDLVLLPGAGPEQLGEDSRIGGGLVPAFWEAGEAADLIAERAVTRAFRFGEIPTGVAPESVLFRLDQLAVGEAGNIER